MAKILFTWEMGEGSGHIAPYLTLIKELEARGHRITFSCKFLSRAFRLFEGTNVCYVQSPHVSSPPADQIWPVDSFAKILNNSGYSHPQQLAGMIRAWRNLFELVKPDLIIADYSPTAILASRESGIPRLQIGTGFYQVPTQGKVPSFIELQGQVHHDPNGLTIQSRILEHINTALKLNGMQAIEHFNQSQNAECKLFRTFKEFDHYPNREPAQYIGAMLSKQGQTPEWPAGNGPKVFAYLKPFASIGQLFMQLNQLKFPTLIYPDGIEQKIIREFSSATLKFVDKPLDMRQIGESASFAIHNGNHGTVCELMLAGVPSLVLSLHAEQSIMGHRLQSMSAGLTFFEKSAEQFHMGLKALSQDGRYKLAAQAFADKHKDFKPTQPIQTILATIDTILS